MKPKMYQLNNPTEEWGSQWKERLKPSGGSKVIQKWNALGKKPKVESSTEYAKKQAQPQRTWRSDVADTFHNIGEGILALHPYTAIPYYGAKVGQDVINNNVGIHTALNATVPLIHYTPQIAQGTVTFVKNPGQFVFDHLPYKTMYNIKSNIQDAATFLRTPIDENPIKAVQNARALRSGTVNPIKFDISRDQLPSGTFPNTNENGLGLLKTRYKYAYTNNKPLFNWYDPMYGSFTLNELPYQTNITSIPIRTYIPFGEVLKDSKGFFNGINNYLKVNTEPAFFSPGKHLIKINRKALKDFGISEPDAITHETVHALDIHPWARIDDPPKFINNKYLPENIQEYLLDHSEEELVARGTQLKNYFGLKGNEPITPEMLKYAAKNYVKDTGMDNNMTQMFNAITDWDAAAQWFSKYSLKQGGKMNIIEQFKKGYKIKIKESQKGSFTKYCNGKVTNECIQRGKNSPDPKIRKKATFAQNSRRWKHQLGGQIFKAQEGSKFLSKQWFQNTGQKVGNFLNSDSGQATLNFISNGVNAISNQSKITNFSNEFDKATEAGKKNLQIQNWNKKYQEGLAKGQQYFQMQQLYNPGINFGTVDIQNFAKNYADSAGASEEVNEYENNRLAMKKDYIQSMQQSSSSSGGFDIAGLLGTAGKYLSQKSSNNSSTSNNLGIPKTSVVDNYDYVKWLNDNNYA